MKKRRSRIAPQYSNDVNEAAFAKLAAEMIDLNLRDLLGEYHFFALDWFNRRDTNFGGYGWALNACGINPNFVRAKIEENCRKYDQKYPQIPRPANLSGMEEMGRYILSLLKDRPLNTYQIAWLCNSSHNRIHYYLQNLYRMRLVQKSKSRRTVAPTVWKIRYQEAR